MKTIRPIALCALLLGLGLSAGHWWGARRANPPGLARAAPAASGAARTVLYWYDPMSPNARFDKPGKSPFMDMELVPKYADAAAEEGGVTIDARVAQNLGLRIATVTRAPLSAEVQVSGQLRFDERAQAIVQTRSAGFVERAAPLAVGDRVASGALLAELLVPEWAAAQQDYLALRALGQAELGEAALARLRLNGMPEGLIRQLVASGRVQQRIALNAPRAGVIAELGVRQGMSLPAGATLARIQGLDPIWVEAAVPESQAASLRVGQPARIAFAAWPGAPAQGRVAALLPMLDDATRTLRVRIELPNPQGRLRPGLSAEVMLIGMPGESALFVPTEAVIRTGRRALVMRAEPQGRYRPVEVRLGVEQGSMTQILTGLDEGERIVSSAQFLLDSEASLKDLRPLALPASAAGSQP